MQSVPEVRWVPDVRCVPVADCGLLVELATEISDEASDMVMALDRAIITADIAGISEVVPAFVNLLVVFDPVVLDHDQVRDIVRKLLPDLARSDRTPTIHEIPVCYEGEFGRDIEAVATTAGLSTAAVIEQHLGGDYRVGMYGFAPGYAYLSGVPQAIQVPRKTTALPGIPAGSVIIAGPQCLITTLEMPTGWSILGRSPSHILRAEQGPEAQQRPPVLFDVGDHIKFVRIDRTAFDAAVDSAAVDRATT